jgi:hypothetical protein
VCLYFVPTYPPTRVHVTTAYAPVEHLLQVGDALGVLPARTTGTCVVGLPGPVIVHAGHVWGAERRRGAPSRELELGLPQTAPRVVGGSW